MENQEPTIPSLPISFQHAAAAHYYATEDWMKKRGRRNKIRKTLYERSFYEFLQAAWPVIEPGREFLPNYHIGAICEHLEAVARGQIKRLCINISPGTGKSIIVSTLWPCWVWTTDARSRWLFASHSNNIAIRDSQRRRDIFRSRWYREYWHAWGVKSDQDTMHRFENNWQGWMLSTSTGASSTGEHSSYLIYDDPHDRMDRYSKRKREEAINWYGTVFSSLNLGPDTRYLVVAQRITEDDMTGHILSKELGYEHLCIPLFWDASHPHATRVTSIGWQDPRTKDGEVMWPAMFPPDTIAQMRREKSSYDITAQYQQNPTRDEGAMFPRSSFLYFHSEYDGDDELFVLTGRDGKERRVYASQCRWFQTIDTALETTKDSAWTVCGTFAIASSPAALLVYDVARERLPVPKQLGWIIAQKRRHPRVCEQCVEKKASGHGLLQEAAMQGIPLRALKPGDKSKDMRMVPLSIQYENGLVYHREPQQAPWLEIWENELAGLPDSEFRDQADVGGYAGELFGRVWLMESQGSQSLAFTPEMQAEAKDEAEAAATEEGHAPRPPSLADELTAWRAELGGRNRIGGNYWGDD